MFAFNVILNLHQISRCLLNHCAKSSITTEINMQFNIIMNRACTMYTRCTKHWSFDLWTKLRSQVQLVLDQIKCFKLRIYWYWNQLIILGAQFLANNLFVFIQISNKMCNEIDFPLQSLFLFTVNFDWCSLCILIRDTHRGISVM